jgi:hypothetical protein
MPTNESKAAVSKLLPLNPMSCCVLSFDRLTLIQLPVYAALNLFNEIPKKELGTKSIMNCADAVEP